MGELVAVDVVKINSRVRWGYIHSAMTMLVLLLVVCLIGGISLRFGGARIFMVTLEFTIVGSILIGGFSELIVTSVFMGVQPDQERYPRFIEAAEGVARECNMRMPRLYVLHMGVPNAAAFGLGFFGQYAVGITPELYELLSPLQLKGVIAHEFGHIKSRDMMLMTIVSIITGFARKLANALLQSKTVLGKSPFAFLFGYAIQALAQIVQIVQSILSQEREFQADAMSAKCLGTVDPLLEALTKLAGSRPKDEESDGGEKATILDGLTISHPRMEYRLEALEDLRLPQTDPQPAAKETVS